MIEGCGLREDTLQNCLVASAGNLSIVHEIPQAVKGALRWVPPERTTVLVVFGTWLTNYVPQLMQPLDPQEQKDKIKINYDNLGQSEQEKYVQQCQLINAEADALLSEWHSGMWLSDFLPFLPRGLYV